MKLKYLSALAVALFFIFAFFVILAFINPHYIDGITTFARFHSLLGPVLLALWRIFGVLVPSVPAGVVSFAAVPIYGWFKTYIFSLCGILIGTSLSFLLARRFRETLVTKFLPLQKIHKMEDEMSAKKEFLAIVLLRLFTVPVMDFSSYIAGLTKISFKKFFVATFIASLPDIAIFYFAEQLHKRIFRGSITVSVFVLFFLALGYFLFRKYKKYVK